MDKKMLEEYIDACKVAEDTERELEKKNEKVLCQQMERAESIKRQIEEWLVGQPMRMQRIVRYRIFQRLSWEETAQKMGRGATRDSVRMEYRRFFEKNESQFVLFALFVSGVLLCY